MEKNFIISISALVDTFSRVESGAEFDFLIETINGNQSDEMDIGDKIIASIHDKIYYSFDVVGINGNETKLKKLFEIEKSIDYELSEDGLFQEISDYEYSSICSKLFNAYQDCSKENADIQIALPIKEKNIGQFVYKSISFLNEVDGLSRILSHFETNDDVRYISIKTNEIKLTSIFRVSQELLSREDLTFNDDILRFFEEPLFIDNSNNHYYLSTQWTDNGKGRLDFGSFKLLIKACYSEYRVYKEDDFYVFSLNTNKEFNVSQSNFNFYEFVKAVHDSGLKFSDDLIHRFIAALQTKQFIILTGLSGSGKTKLAEAFSSWVCELDEQVCMVAVGADWTNREPLLGFPNSLVPDDYVEPESGVLNLILSAQSNPDYPYFLILDEMNMSHVERYLADFLSALESVNSTISLHSGDKEWSGIPSKVTLPKNLFIIGTVNVDETTYMFSPKVLDRANVIEFRVKYSEMDDYLNSSINLDMKKLNGKGAHMAQDFVSIALGETGKVEGLSDKLMPFFDNLQTVGAEFGYRSASEISRFVGIYNSMTGIIEEHDAIDAAIAQKLLPKLHGSRNKLQRILVILAKQCLYDTSREDAFKDVSEDDIKYPISYEKLKRMHERIMADGFTSFAEA
jgi:energy-coupling factor transporter ATP-binding protein EcfA2